MKHDRDKIIRDIVVLKLKMANIIEEGKGQRDMLDWCQEIDPVGWELGLAVESGGGVGMVAVKSGGVGGGENCFFFSFRTLFIIII